MTVATGPGPGTGFDAEGHLRRLGERALAVGGDLHHAHRNGRYPLPDTAGAFVAAGLLEPVRARGIVEAYWDAANLIGRARAGRRLWDEPAEPPALAPRRVWPLTGEIPTGFGVVVPEALIAAPDTIRLPATVQRREGRPFGSPSRLTLRTPAGAAVRLAFSGRFGEGLAEGDFHGPGPLEDGLTAIELQGRSWELGPPVPAPPVRSGPVGTDRPGLDYLWQRLAELHLGYGRDNANLLGALDALIAASAVDAADPEVAALRWVAAHRRQGPGRATAGPAGPVPPGVPDRWRSELIRSPGSGVDTAWTVAVGALIPALDGVSASLNVVAQDRAGVHLDLDLAGSPVGGPHGADPIANRTVACWIADDLGEHRLGDLHGVQDLVHDVRFGPLSPHAKEITISLETAHTAARCTVPLPGARP